MWDMKKIIEKVKEVVKGKKEVKEEKVRRPDPDLPLNKQREFR